MSTELNANAPSWSELEGRVLDGRYLLEKCHSAAGNRAVFGTKSVGQEQSSGILKVIALETDEAARQLESWQAVQKLRHPNLVRMLYAGSAEIESIPVVYAVMEPTDEVLAAVLKDRRLQKDEAEQVAGSAVNALEYVHSNGFVHAGLEPQNIFAVGETIKIASDCIQPPGAPYRKFPEGYEAPEVATNGLSAVSDFWLLGAALFEVLSQRAPSAGEPVDTSVLPRPFTEIVAGCLNPDVAKRWTARQVRTALHPYASAAMPGRPEHSDATRPLASPISGPPRRITAQEAFHKSPTWIYAILLLIGVFSIAWYLVSRPSVPKNRAPVQRAGQQHSNQTPKSEAPPVAASPRKSAPVASGQSRVVSPSAAAPRPVPPNALSDWRVVVYTYSREDDARQRARAINSKRPGLQAEVFSPGGGAPPYLVAIGGWMDRDSANRLRQRAIKLGLPRDTYAQNFRK